MESDITPQQALAQAERASASVWIDYPPTPGWYFPLVGGWATAFLAALVAVEDPWRLLAIALLIGAEVAFVGWMKRSRGTWPQISKAPADFRPAIRAFFAGLAGLLIAVVATQALVGLGLAAPLLFVGTTAGLYVYEKAYERAAERTRRRLDRLT